MARLLSVSLAALALLFSTPAVAAVPDGSPRSVDRTPPLVATSTYINLASTKAQQIDLMAVDPAASLLYVAHKSLGTLDIVDLTSNVVVTSINGIPGANGVSLDTANKRAFVGEEGDSSLVTIDTVGQKVTGKIATGGTTTDAVIYVPKVNRVFADNDDSNTMTVIDPDKQTVVATITLPGSPELVAWNPNDSLLYQSISDVSVIAVIDPVKMTVVKTMPLPSGTNGPKGLFVDVSTNRLWVATLTPAVVIFDLTAGQPIARIPIATGVDDIQFDTGRRLVYQPSKSGTLQVIDANSGVLLQQATIASGSHTVAVNPNNGTVYVAEQKKDRLAVIPRQFEPGEHARYAGQSTWPSIKKGVTTTLTMSIENTGTTAWVKGTSTEVRLGTDAPHDSLTEASAFGTSTWLSPNRPGSQNEASVGPGAIATFSITVTGTQVGTFPLHLAPVIDGVGWLEDDGEYLTITVN